MKLKEIKIQSFVINPKNEDKIRGGNCDYTANYGPCLCISDTNCETGVVFSGGC